MPIESSSSKRKLESNLAVYLKIAEREFSGKNYKIALKNFKNAYEIATELNLVEEAIKTLDTQASCHEHLGNFDEAITLAIKLVSKYKISPVGYLRLGKLLRLKKETEEARKVYEIGLIKASKKDQFYQILEKQLNAVVKVINNTNADMSCNDSGNILSIPSDILSQICDCLSSSNPSSLRNFALTSFLAFKVVMGGILSGNFGESIDLRSLKSSHLYSKLFKEYSVLERFNSQSCSIRINSENATLLFLIYLKKVMTNLKGSLKIKNIWIGPLTNVVHLFKECLQQGLKVQRLKIDFADFISATDSLKQLNELSILNYTMKSSNPCYQEASSDLISKLECLQIEGEGGCRIFSNCKRLKYLIYPSESDFNSFLSERVILACLKYEQNITMRPRPIRYLSLYGSLTDGSVDTIDLTQYTYESIIVLHLNQMTLNQFDETCEIIKSSCWNELKCLRLNRIFFANPKKDVMWILSKCPKDLEILELVSVPLSGLNDFNTNENGTWLIESIFEQFPNLKHLILGDLTIGPSGVNNLIKKLLAKKLKKLSVFGFLKIQISLGFNYEQSLAQTFRTTYPWSYLLVNDRQYEVYSNEFNLFKNEKLFLTI